MTIAALDLYLQQQFGKCSQKMPYRHRHLVYDFPAGWLKAAPACIAARVDTISHIRRSNLLNTPLEGNIAGASSNRNYTRGCLDLRQSSSDGIKSLSKVLREANVAGRVKVGVLT